MRSAALIGLGLKLALGSDRGAKLRFALMAASIAVGVTVIVGAFSVIPAIQARDARVAGLEYFATDGRTDAPDQLILTERESWFEGRKLQRLLVSPIGDAPIPPGLERLPGPGEIVVSPALRELLQGPQGALLDDRLRGRVVGIIGASGLLHPDELTAYLGVRRSEIEKIERSYVTGFGTPESSTDIPVHEAVLQSVIFGSAGVLLPVLVFVWTATRLSAGLRETRLAAIRLAGATPRQVRLLSAVESGLAASAGTALGFGLFLATRELLALSVELGLKPSDAVPPLTAILCIGIGIPVLAIVVAWLALRRITHSPLSVVRKAPRRSRIAGPAAVALAIGIGQWLSVAWALRWENSWPWIVFILGAWVLTALGVLGLAPWIGTRAAGWITRRTESLGTWLGARRLETDGRAAARVSTATVVVVFAAGIAAGYMVYFDGTAGGLRASASLRPETVVVDSWRGDVGPVLDEIAAVDGAGQTAALRTTHLVEAGTQNYLAGITILSCRDLPNVLLAAPPNCDTGAILLHNPEESNVLARVSPGDLATFVPYSDSEYVPFPIHVPDRVLSTEFSADNGYDGYVIDEAAAPEELLRVMPVTRILVATDGRDETVEKIREAVAWTDPFPTVLTRSELAVGEEGSGFPIRFAIELGTYFALAVAAASLLVSTVGAVQERRKPLAALAALGVPAGALRRSVLVQTMAPLVAGVVLAGLAAAVVVLSSTPDGRPLPWSSLVAPIGRFVALAVIAGSVASVLAFPSLRRGIRPEALHHE